MNELIARLRGELAIRPPVVSEQPGLRRAAVLAPIVTSSEPRLLFTVRTEDVPTHKGQVSFPGGRVESGDPDLGAAALRETAEEVGIEPAQVDLLGQLDELDTYSALFTITPFVGLVPPDVARITSPREVARIVEVPLSELLLGHLRQPDPRTHHWTYSWESVEVWGATARILSQLLTILGLVDPFAEDLALLRSLSDPGDRQRFMALMADMHDRHEAAGPAWLASRPPR
ncbi:MAG: CoA pyrophosphatase [Chloroflexi bacterium]|nr:CoA pyrophosphatase [Chloroflexota bacterium]